MKQIKIIAFILLVLAMAASAFGQDMFSRNEPVQFSRLQKLLPTNTIREYPLLPIGGTWLHLLSKVSYSTGTNVPLGRVIATDVRDKKLFATIDIVGNLQQTNSGDWVDEPCKREDFLWKRSTGGLFKNINCASINHVVNFFVAPTGDFQQMLVTFRDQEIEIPPTVIRVDFTRYADGGRRLTYSININPEFFGISRDSTLPWGANSWHKTLIARDPKKVEFISRLSMWAGAVQDRLDNAFLKRGDAFAGLESLERHLSSR